MHLNRMLPAAVALLIAVAATPTTSAAEGYPWRDHAAPFAFLFGNHIDSFQQSKVDPLGLLRGFLYAQFTGDYGPDGLPVAMHADCSGATADCEAGWVLAGLPMQATLVAKGATGPVWCIVPEDVPPAPGYSHFHWLDASAHPDGLVIGETYEGYLLKLTARDSFRFVHHGGIAVLPGIDAYSHANTVVGC